MHIPVRLFPRPTRRSRGAAALCAVLAAALAAVAVSLPQPASAVPVRGHTGWSVLLCKFTDQPQEPRTPQFFQEFLTNAGIGSGGVADYFANQSGGRITLQGSVVRGWYRMGHTLAEDRTLDRATRISRCRATAAAGGYTVPAGHRVLAILNAAVDSGAAFVGGPVVLDPNGWSVGFAAHEMLHTYGLGHSFSNDANFRIVDWANPGEYDDPWDEMSAMNIHSFTTTRFSTSAVGLNGYHRDRLGWLPRPQVLRFGADGVGSGTVTLTALEAVTVPVAVTRLIRIPFNPANLNQYYTVEYRRKTGWSAGIPASTVLIHEVRDGISYLIRDLTHPSGTRPPIQSLNRNGVRVTVGTVGTTATVTVTSDIVDRCLSGYVWREARPTDRVCVTMTVRAEVAADNEAAPARWVNGPSGPHTCVSGYVWREAFPGDDVCVVPARRTQAAADNAAAASRRNPARLVNGPNTCVAGYVWREVDQSDYVCVTMTVRDDVAADNAAAHSRWVNGPSGPHTCITGYVWREAIPRDDVCVIPSRRTQAAADNAAAASRVQPEA